MSEFNTHPRRDSVGPVFARLVVAAILLCTAAPARAQEPLRQVLSFLLTNQSVPTGDFVKDREAAAITSDTITRFLLADLTTLPIASSSAGFTYRFNALLGTVERASPSFGPFFTERALTAGRGQASIGFSVQGASFDSLDGRGLRDATFVTTANRFRDEPAAFDVETLQLNLDSRTLTVFGNVGVTDRFDLGVAVPIVSVSFTGERVNTYRGRTLVQAHATGDATGVGDIAVRGKVRLVGDAALGLAALGEVRLPTGRDEDLLGAGEASFSAYAIASAEQGIVAVHGNFGLTRGGIADQWDYSGAVNVSATPRLTLIGEIVGRHLDNLGRVVEEIAPHPTIVGVDTIRLVSDGTGTTTAFAVAGIKWNVGATWLLSANVSLPITDGGLRSGLVPVIQLDYAFGR
jgi:hypothetical protein